MGVVRTDSPGPRKSPDAEFVAQTEALRHELFAHCYRMLGSAHDAEDLVQETYLRAWQALGSFERRSSMRTWLYRIATNACLNAVDAARRRALPMQLWPPSVPSDEPTERTDVPWLEPLPTYRIGGVSPEEAAIERESLRLAFVAMLQTLPPRQRALLLLRDVLRFTAAETAEILDTTTTAVNSGVRRAREQAIRAQPVSEPTEPERRRLLDRYVTAWEAKDVPAIVALFTEDAVWEMPPLAAWYRGAEHIGRHLADRCPVRPGQASLVPVEMNAQPAFATYTLEPDGSLRPAFLQVLDVSTEGIEHVYAFVDPSVFELLH
ncbi:sigma-70 family RNA polymerase sigma factor [Pseudonocardia sp. DSM 110487]|nr:sigma-70 family RNA polymerase sigma factor [Pseudonocardia sp. DSM 110487]